jgi:hypothetical protein
MPLPGKNAAWPPAEHTERYTRMVTASTWYGGDPKQLATLYSGSSGSSTGETSRAARNAMQRLFGWFWGRTDPTQPDDKVHVPLAQDLAARSAEDLFSESPKFLIQPTEFLDDGTPNPAQKAQIAKTQARLDELLDNCDMESLMLAAAETSAALGSTGLRIAYDKRNGMTMPRITRSDADSIIPEYEWGELVAVTFWRVLERKGETWIYHLERHERGLIYHGLYQGVRGSLGLPIPLTDHPATLPLAGLVDAEGAIAAIADQLTAVSIPNMLPDPLDRGNNAGRGDFSPGTITLFDAIDKTMTSLMRDIEDGKSRLIIAEYMAENRGVGKGLEFDGDQRQFLKLKMQPGETGDAPITQVQFKIRVEEHLKALDLLVRQAVQSTGRNSEGVTNDDGRDVTATEYTGKTNRGVTTRGKKLRYWKAIERLLFTLLTVDAELFQSGVVPMPVKFIPAPSSTPDMRVLAETVNLMKQAEAASIEVRVSTLHPDWDQDEVDEEVKRIQAATSVIDPNTFGLGGGNGFTPKAEAKEEAPA